MFQELDFTLLPLPRLLSSTTNSEHIIGDGAILIDADDDVHIPALPCPPLIPPPQPRYLQHTRRPPIRLEDFVNNMASPLSRGDAM